LVASPAQTADPRKAMHSANALKLGLFCTNASSGRVFTHVAERWPASWDENRVVGAMADAAGFEFLLPIGRWKGYGGDTNCQGESFETLTWATAMLAVTQHITVFATVHAPLVNPVAAAKALVTADHVGAGRAGLNIVVGWNEDEFAMFGVAQRAESDRYPYAQEWIDVVTRLWSSEQRFEFDGRFLHLRDVEGNPKPVGGTRPVLMNAGRSPAGRAYAIENCDAFFTDIAGITDDEAAARVRSFQAEARSRARDLDVYSDGLVICRPSQREADEYYRYALIENADWGAIDQFLAKKGIRRDNTQPDVFEGLRRDRIAHMTGRNLVGDPESIAAELAGLSRAGLRGMALNFVNYLDELPYFCDEVLPRLERAGLRSPAVS
jgi:alkanesulfonate monooxygenase SsuD/methylene tetrahydromethanopterin reductase-like flavin-dependent oxidoreductase (luciferase family)